MRSRMLWMPVLAVALIGATASCDDDEIVGLDDVPEAFQEEATWMANLTSEVAGVPAMATGRAFFVDRGNSLEYYMEWSGLTSPVTNAHIHLTSNQGVLVPLAFVRQQNGSVVGTIDMSPSQTDISSTQAGNQTPADLRALLGNGGVYVNIHTQTNAGGEIRGTLNPR